MYLLPRMMLLLLLSAGTSLAVNTNWLTDIIRVLRNEYQITVNTDMGRRRSQFCLAVNIPVGQDPNTLLNQVLQNDRYSDDLQEELDSERRYARNAVVLAVPAGGKHAEPIVLENLGSLRRNAQGNILVIYTLLSPCSKCTGSGRNSITRLIRNQNLNRWADHAFVFTKLFTDPGYSMPGESGTRSRKELEQSVIDLGESGFGLRKIFRCYQPPQEEFQCHSCSSGRQVANVCVEQNARPQEGGSRSSDRNRSRSRSSDRSRSRSSSSDRNRSRSRSSDGRRSRSSDTSRSRSSDRSRSRSSSDRNRRRSSSSDRSRSSNTSRSSSSNDRRRKRPRYRTESKSSSGSDRRSRDRTNRRRSGGGSRSSRRRSSSHRG